MWRRGVKRILVVEDDPDSREALGDWLRGAGYSVETAADGWQAIKKVKAGRFDVAITDLDLPIPHGFAISGWDLLRIFRAYNPEIPLIVMSAEQASAARTQAEKLYASGFFTKPINLPQLKAMVVTLTSAPSPVEKMAAVAG